MSEIKRRIIAAAVIMIWLGAGYVFAEEPITFESDEAQVSLIELFTSEGCSSCPPAEKWLSNLKSSPDLWKKIVPIAFHVDYWNHLGWRDRFSKPQFTERQRRYAAAWGGDSIYTPGFVLNGREWSGWFGRVDWPAAQKVGVLRVTLSSGTNFAADFVPQSTQSRAFNLNVAMLSNDLRSAVARGENAGRKLEHDFVVLQFVKSDMMHDGKHWTGSVALPIQSSADKPSAIAAWVTENAIPVQATGGWLR
jgi:hypothetical protein